MSAWRGSFKVAAFDALPGWEISPTKHQMDEAHMTPADILAFKQRRVAVLLHKDAFCDDGVNPDVRVYKHITSIIPLMIILGPSSSLQSSRISEFYHHIHLWPQRNRGEIT